MKRALLWSRKRLMMVDWCWLIHKKVSEWLKWFLLSADFWQSQATSMWHWKKIRTNGFSLKRLFIWKNKHQIAKTACTFFTLASWFDGEKLFAHCEFRRQTCLYRESCVFSKTSLVVCDQQCFATQLSRTFVSHADFFALRQSCHFRSTYWFSRHFRKQNSFVAWFESRPQNRIASSKESSVSILCDSLSACAEISC